MNKRLTLLDQIVYSAILAESILYFAHIYYGKGLDLTVSLLCLLLHFCVFSVIYQIVLTIWKKWAKGEFSFIIKSIFSKKQQTKPKSALHSPSESTASNYSDDAQPEAESVVMEKEISQQENLDAQFLFMNHFIGQSLNDSQKVILKANLKAFALEDTPTLLPVTSSKIGNYGIYDILHLCHAIGHHTMRSKTIEDIAHFAKACFPKYCDKWEVTTISRKLTYTDYPNPRIKVVPKSEELPIYDSF